MDGISSGPSLEAQIYAIEKAIDVQGQGVLKVLNSAVPANVDVGASLTGLGQKLDIKG